MSWEIPRELILFDWPSVRRNAVSFHLYVLGYCVYLIDLRTGTARGMRLTSGMCMRHCYLFAVRISSWQMRQSLASEAHLCLFHSCMYILWSRSLSLIVTLMSMMAVGMCLMTKRIPTDRRCYLQQVKFD